MGRIQANCDFGEGHSRNSRSLIEELPNLVTLSLLTWANSMNHFWRSKPLDQNAGAPDCWQWRTGLQNQRMVSKPTRHKIMQNIF